MTGDGDEGEDKIEKSARLSSKSAWEIAEFYAADFRKSFALLNCLEPYLWAKATDHIPDQIALIEKLDKKGFLYRTSDGMYFDTSLIKNYGALARLNIEGQKEGARVVKNSQKKNPTDFAVWKFSPKNEKRQMEWESPWGLGFPGWHIECSAMSMKYLGATLDIHSGGIDHIPVHHCNEIAQSEAASGKPFVHYWLHNDFVMVNDGKMAKSLGNTYTLDDLQDKGFSALSYRFFCLGTHYRSKLNFTWEAIESSQIGFEKLKNKFLDLGQQNGEVNAEFLEKFSSAVNDDLNTSQALAIAWDVLKSDLNDFDKRATLLKFDEVLGLGLDKLNKLEIVIPEDIKALAAERWRAKQDKRFDKSDEIRKLISKMGYEVEDEATGYTIKQR